jgi:DNA replication protein DnaC
MKLEQQLHDLRLQGMMKRWESLKESKQLQGLSLLEGFGLLLQAESELRYNRKKERLIKQASFRYQASLNEVAYLPERELDKTTIGMLSDGSYIDKGDFVLITGATGCGKSFLATALGQQACTQGFKTQYISIKKMFNQLKIARIEGTYIKYVERISKQQLLIIDDFGLVPIDQQQAVDLMEIIEDRHSKQATIVASQLPVSTWYDIIPDSTIADAILDRIIHTAIRIELKGESLRKKK